MHDIDKTAQEYDMDRQGSFDEELEWEWENSDWEAEEDFLDTEQSYFSDNGYESELPFSEEEEIALATELLNINSDEELDLFLGKIGRAFKRIGRKAKRFFKSRGFRKFGRFLKGVARKALPIAGRVVGGIFGGPVGSKLGGSLGGFASSLFELELEGFSPEDQEFEIARRFVRFAGSAFKNAAELTDQMPSEQAATMGIKIAARKHAPGLLKRGFNGVAPRSGRWIRKGNRIILFGI